MEPVRYHLSIADAHQHQLAVTATFAGPFPQGALEVRLPGWTPGSYLVREFARQFLALEATDERGNALPVKKLEKARWRVEAGGVAKVALKAKVYANELTVRTSHVDGTHAFFNGANVFLFREETLGAPCVLSLDVPEGWRVATALPAGGEPGSWRADDYDHLVDCPVEMGLHDLVTFDVDGVPHRVAIWGEGNHDRARVAADLEKIVRAQKKLMGGLPFSSYLFILHLTDKGRGGLEHRDSTALLYPRFGFRPKKEYEEFLRLASHEYFHSWNVKRLKPKAFDPYDLTKETYTRLLWAMEGFTEYYEIIALARAGLVSRERLLSIFGEEITGLLRTPGRAVQSLADSSFDTWIKYYRPDENSVNAGISYYRKGALVALALDLEMRAATGNAKSLDDLMRTLFERHGAKGRGAPEDAYSKTVAELAPGVEKLLARYVDGTDEIDFAAHLKNAGLSFHLRPADGPDDKGGAPGKRARKKDAEAEESAEPKVWLGFETRAEARKLAVASVLAGSPAAAAGIYAGDELVAVDGWRADEKGWRARANERGPGERIVLTVFRRDRLLEIPVTGIAPPANTAWLEADDAATPAAKAILASWAGG
jgi:predicted metalloprotease with PDZ domain